MPITPSSVAATDPPAHSDMITEDEASLYDRQIRLWGLEAQNRMRSSTILILTLRALSQETIKNLVLAGVGRLIVMDDADVSEEDLGAGLLFREGEDDVGKKRVEAALPQIKSLNPLVQVTPIRTLYPFVGGDSAGGPAASSQSGISNSMDEFLLREKVDLVCATDMSRKSMIEIDAACRRNGKAFYGSGSYGFLGYILNDLGPSYDYVRSVTDQNASAGPSKLLKKQVNYPSIADALQSSPFKGLTRNMTKEKMPGYVIAVQAVWEYQEKHGRLPDAENALPEMNFIAEELRKRWEVNEKAMKVVPDYIIHHVATLSKNEFSPTAAILGGLLAQDILRTLSRKEKPVMNLSVIHTMEGIGAVSRWGVEGDD